MRLAESFRLVFLTIKIFLIREKMRVSIGVLVLLIIFISVVRFKSWYQLHPRTVFIGLVVESQKKGELPSEVEKLLSRGLTQIDQSGLPIPALAPGWDTNETGDEYRFQVRSGVNWNDGSQFKLTDLKIDIPGVAYEVENNNSIVFKLKNPYSPFPTILAKPLFKDQFIGFGPYRLINQQINQGVIESVTLEVDAKRFKIKFYPNEEVSRTALKLGEVDGLVGIRDPGDLANWPSLISITYYPKNRFVGIFFNNQDQLLSSKEIRQALSYAIPSDFPGEPISGPIDPDSWAYNPDVKRYDYDLNKARDLIGSSASAEIILTTLPIYESLAKLITKSWQTLGLDAKTETVQILPKARGNFQSLLVGQKVPVDPDQYSLWHSTQTTNITGYMSPRIDKLLEDARKSLDLEERKELYYKFQKYLVEDAPASFLYRPEEYVFFTKRAKNHEVQRLIGDIIN